MRKRFMVVGLACLALAVVASVSWAAIGHGGTVKTCFAKGKWTPIDSSTGCKAGEQSIDLYSKAGADATFLGINGKAANSDLLDGMDSSDLRGVFGYVEADGTVLASRGGLNAQALPADSTVFLLSYPGFDPGSPPVVIVTPVVTYGDQATAEVIPHDDPNLLTAFGPLPPGVVVQVANSTGRPVAFNVLIKPSGPPEG
jgi:hypothetical protein